jgi:hypothetical protein
MDCSAALHTRHADREKQALLNANPRPTDDGIRDASGSSVHRLSADRDAIALAAQRMAEGTAT